MKEMTKESKFCKTARKTAKNSLGKCPMRRTIIGSRLSLAKRKEVDKKTLDNDCWH